VKGAIQDGSGEFETSSGEVTEQRYSIAVAKGGAEAAVIRILSRKLPKLEDIHLDAVSRRAIDWFLEGDGGMFVVTGPTGSGKTTTLYACLSKIDLPETKIITVEHPVEKHLPGAVQIDVREDGDITFKTALKCVVRQDPDVIMIGEIRDNESAAVAVNAALTGHSVFSTIHAIDPVGVLERLCQSFQIDRMTAAQALRLVLSQRLVRRLCPLCKKVGPARAEDLRFFPETDIANPIQATKVGCPACRFTGYAGRIAIAEVLMFDPIMVALVENREPAGVLRARNRERGFLPLGDQASLLAQTGEISFAEAKLLMPTAQI
jgi:type II secretory ATPase GspE/PulE/Tfp pilus assembly ATPase PilB-like protein